MQQISRTHSLAQSLRISSTLLPWLLCSSILVAYNVTNVAAFILCSLLIVTSYGFVTIYNDLSDYKIDTANRRKDIPLADSRVSRKDLRDLLLGLMIIGCITAALLSNLALLWLSMYFLLGWLYSGPANFKGRGALALITLGICYGIMPLLLGYIIANETLSAQGCLLLVASFLFSAGIVSLKDFKDIKGDSLHNKRTLLVQYGPDITHKLIITLTCLAYLAIIAGIHISNGRGILFYVSIAAVFLNLFLLWPKEVRVVSAIRKRNGNLARFIFFIYISIVSIMLLGT